MTLVCCTHLHAPPRTTHERARPGALSRVAQFCGRARCRSRSCMHMHACMERGYRARSCVCMELMMCRVAVPLSGAHACMCG
jgi:hypothetical protein